MGQAGSSQEVSSSHSRRTPACEMAVAEPQQEPQSVVAARSIESSSVVVTQPQSSHTNTLSFLEEDESVRFLAVLSIDLLSSRMSELRESTA
jgi:hypothetical protein